MNSISKYHPKVLSKSSHMILLSQCVNFKRNLLISTTPFLFMLALQRKQHAIHTMSTL